MLHPAIDWSVEKSPGSLRRGFRGGPTEVRLNRALLGLSFCQTLRRVVLSTTHETPTMTWSYSPCNIGVFLGSIVVSILPCHGSDPGSIPGRGALFREIHFTFLGELAQMVESKLRNQEVIGSILSRRVLFCPNGQKGRDKNETG
jgi:hypothetical protein